ncbi:MAG: tripartite tricarboxylate transporter substrate-binding protein [Rubripirellula sp.]
MNKPILIWHAVAGTAIFALLAWQAIRIASQESAGEYPDRPIQVVVPYDAGGGSDTFVRILQKGIAEDGLLDQPLVIINQSGGSGTIGSREVKNATPDGYKILCHHNAIITAKLAETVDYGPEAFEAIALTGEMSMVILVRDDSEYRNIKDLLLAAKRTPKSVRFGANKGAPSYFTTLQLEKAVPGAEFNIVSAGGGADRYSKILGGHLESGIFSLSEYLDFRGTEGTPPDQNIRAIALLSSERHESIPDVPTATEMGVPVVLKNANYWWAPKETPEEVLDQWATVLGDVMQNETVLGELSRLRMDPTFDRGDSFKQRLSETVDQFTAVAEQKQASLPNFTLYVGVLVGLLLIWTVVEAIRGDVKSGDSVSPELSTDYVKRPGIAAACFIALCVYVVLLRQDWMPFAVASVAMVIVIGGIMMRAAPARWLVLIELALLTGLGAQFVFSEVFVTPLP